MAPSNRSSSSPRRSWRRERAADTSPGMRTAKRLLLTALGAVLTVIFIYAIWWFVTPGANVHFYSLALVYPDRVMVVPVAFSDGNVRQIEALPEAAFVPVLQQLDAPTSGHAEGMAKVAGRIQTTRKDTLIFYLNAHGVSDGDQAYVLCSDYDPARADAGRITLDSFVQQIERCPAQIKVLLLDSGRIPSDVRLGMANNEFPQLLKNLKSQDPNLWIINSNSMGEVSGWNHPERGSVLLHFATVALGGEADGYGADEKDQKVDLREFWEYLQDHVSAWAEAASGGTESQTPMLVRANGSEATPDSSMILVRLRKKEEPPEELKKKEGVEGESDTKAGDAAGSRALLVPLVRPAFLANVQEEPKAKAQSKKSDGKDTKKQAAMPIEEAATESDSDEPAEPKKKANSPPPGAGEPPAGQDAEPKPKQAEPKGSSTAPAGLAAGWQFRDRMEIRSPDQPSPIDYAPHIWREFLSQLLVRELNARSGSNRSDREQSVPELVAELERDLGRSAARDYFRSLKARPHTLAATRLFRWSDGDKMRSEFRAAQEQLSELIKLPEEEFAKQFVEWLARPELESLRQVSEVSLAFRLKERAAEHAGDARRWEKVQLALAVRQLGEQAAAAAEWATPWVEKLVHDGDTERVSGERTLFSSGAGAESAFDSLRRARAHYRAALQNAEAVARAIELKNDLTFYAPHYVALHEFYPAINLGQLLASLRELTGALEQADPSRLQEIRVQFDRLAGHRSAIEGELQNLIGTLSANPLGRGNLVKIERLLAAPLFRAAQRQQLLDAVKAAEKEAMGRLIAFKTIRGATTQPAPRPVDRLRLQIELARLLVSSDPAGTEKTDPRSAALEAIVAAEKAYRAAAESASDARSAAIQEVGSALKQFYLAIPAAIVESKITQDTATLRARERMLRVIDPRDVGAVRPTITSQQDPMEAIRSAQLFQLLAWHQERFDRLRNISAPAEREELFQLALTCNKLARSIPNQPSLEPPTSYQAVAAMDCRPPDKLQVSSSGKLAIKVSPIQRQTLTKLSLVVSFDPKLVELTAPARENAVLDVDSIRVAIDLLPDDPKNIQFDIRAKQESDELAALTAQLWSGERVETEESFKLTMPEPQVVQLKVTGGKETVSQDKKSYTLRPFPGHVNEFGFELAARKTREVRVQLRALADSVRDADRRRYEQNGELPAGNDIALKYEGDYLTVTGDAPVKLPFDPITVEPEKSGPAVSSGFVCVIDEKDSRGRTFYWIDIVPLHPSEYLKPEFAREFGEGEVKIQIRPVGSLFPPGGSAVELELQSDETPRGKKGTAMLADSESQDFISVKLDPDRRRNLLVRLNADGYPRAFIFDVDVQQNRAVSRRGALREIRLSSPNRIYAPRPSIPVTVQLDAPNAFRDPDTRVEIAWNSKLAANINPTTPTKKFYGERQFHISLEQTKENGSIAIKPTVSDFQYEVPTAGLENEQLEIVARLVERERADLVSERLQVVVDGTPPLIGTLDLPERVEVGQPLKVAARVTDESPIEKVEFALCDRFDPDKFEKLETKKDGVFDRDRGVYIAQLATEKLEPGEAGLRYSVVARARNENLDKWQFETRAVLIVPKSAKTPDKVGGEIIGTVIAYQKNRPGASVSLAPKDTATAAKLTAPIAPKTSDKNGRFKFDGLPPGTYVLQGAVKSEAYTFRGSMDVVVPGLGSQTVTLELRL